MSSWKNSYATFSWLWTWFFKNRFGKIKDGPTTPLCVTLFLSTFFFVPPPLSPSPALSFLNFFFIPFLGLAGTSGLHCLKTFVCASEHVCLLWYFCCFIVGHTTIDLFLYVFFVVFLAALLFDSIVSNRTTATYTLTLHVSRIRFW